MKKYKFLLTLFLLMLAIRLEAYSGGTGTEADPYQIATVEDLKELMATETDWNKNFIQTADLDLNNSTAGINPIGYFNSWGDYKRFTGSYNGGQHKILNLKIHQPSKDAVGLFGYAKNATISNLGLEGVDINARINAGALMGGAYENVSIINSYAIGSVSVLNTVVGGLVGYAARNSTIANCYTSGFVSGNSFVGGLVGGTYDSTIKNSYARGEVSGIGNNPSNLGGLIGINSNNSSTITHCYWDKETSGQTTSDGGEGKTTSEMKNISTYENWDFPNTWHIDYGGANDGYPSLAWQVLPHNPSQGNHLPKFISTPVETGIIGKGYSYRVLVNDPDGDQLTITALETLPEWLELVQVSNGIAKLCGTPLSLGNFNVKLQVTDAQGGTDTQEFVIQVIDDIPIFISNPVKTAKVNINYLYDIIATGGEAPLIITADGTLPSWLTLVDNGDGTAKLSGVPTTNGEDLVNLRVTDNKGNYSTQEFTIRIKNSKPIFTSNPVTLATVTLEYLYNITATDENKDSLTITVESTLPEWLSFKDNGDGTAKLSGIPTEIGFINITLKVTDGQGEDIQEFILEIPNYDPVFTSEAVLQAFTYEDYIYEVVANDFESDSIAITVLEKPDWLTFVDNGNGTGIFTGFPTQVGDYYVKMKATDNVSKSRNSSRVHSNIQDFTITVRYYNHEPVYTSHPVLYGIVGQKYLYNLTTYDVENHDVILTADQKPEWIEIIDYADGTGKLRGIATEAGSYDIILRVDDFARKSKNTVKSRDEDPENGTTQAFTLVITEQPINHAPVFVSTPVEEGLVNENYLYNIETADIDGDSIIVTAVEKPAWLILFDNGNGTAQLSGVPTEAGSFNLVLKADDEKAKVKSRANTLQSFTITVATEPINHAPEFTSTPIEEGVVGESYIYEVLATDQDGDNLTITAVEKPAWLTLTQTSNGIAKLTGTPNADESFEVKLEVDDNNSSKSRTNVIQEFTVTVTNEPINHAPAFVSTPVVTGQVGENYLYNIIANDQDGDAVTVVAVEKPTWLTLFDNGDGTAKLSGVPTEAGSFTISLKADDGLVKSRANNLQVFTLVITESNHAPEVGSYSPATETVEVSVNEVITFSVNVTDQDNDQLTYQWFVDHQAVSGATDDSFEKSFSVSGTYNVKVTISDGELESSRSWKVVTTTAIAEVIPEETTLYQNYPNPFNPVTKIRFYNASLGNVKLTVYNVKGEVVAKLVDGKMEQGFKTIRFNAVHLKSGVYYYRLETKEKTFTKKMILIK